jgi:hypothetical protein
MQAPVVDVEPSVSNHFSWKRTSMSLQRTLMSARTIFVVHFHSAVTYLRSESFAPFVQRSYPHS